MVGMKLEGSLGKKSGKKWGRISFALLSEMKELE